MDLLQDNLSLGRANIQQKKRPYQLMTRSLFHLANHLKYIAQK